MIEKSQKPILKIMIGLLITVILFHISIIAQIIPYNVVWAGKMKTVKEMRVFETASILINIFLVFILLIKGRYLKPTFSEKILNGILWLFVFVFVINTIGNLLAKTLFEKAVFTPLTLISAILLWIIVRTKYEAINT